MAGWRAGGEAEERKREREREGREQTPSSSWSEGQKDLGGGTTSLCSASSLNIGRRNMAGWRLHVLRKIRCGVTRGGRRSGGRPDGMAWWHGMALYSKACRPSSETGGWVVDSPWGRHRAAPLRSVLTMAPLVPSRGPRDNPSLWVTRSSHGPPSAVVGVKGPSNDGSCLVMDWISIGHGRADEGCVRLVGARTRTGRAKTDSREIAWTFGIWGCGRGFLAEASIR